MLYFELMGHCPEKFHLAKFKNDHQHEYLQLHHVCLDNKNEDNNDY